MARPAIGDKENVKGTKRAMPIVVDNPGIAPMMMPQKVPIPIRNKFVKLKKLTTPRAIF